MTLVTLITKMQFLTKVQHDNVLYEQFGLRVGWRESQRSKIDERMDKI